MPETSRAPTASGGNESDHATTWFSPSSVEDEEPPVRPGGVHPCLHGGVQQRLPVHDPVGGLGEADERLQLARAAALPGAGAVLGRDVLHRPLVVEERAAGVVDRAPVLPGVDLAPPGVRPPDDEVADGSFPRDLVGEVVSRIPEIAANVDGGEGLDRLQAEHAGQGGVGVEDAAVGGAAVDADGQMPREAVQRVRRDEGVPGSVRAERLDPPGEAFPHDRGHARGGLLRDDDDGDVRRACANGGECVRRLICVGDHDGVAALGEEGLCERCG